MRSERPIFSSSSTISTRLEAICLSGQEHAETCAAQFSFHHHDVPARQQRTLACNGKPQPHAPFLEGNGWLKQGGAGLLAQPRSRIVHFDGDSPCFRRGYAQDFSALAGSLRGVLQEVGENAP